MRIQALSAEDIRRVHEATLDTLETIGVWFKDSSEAAELFRSNGCRVEDGRVRIPRRLLTECLARLPDRNELKICVTRLGFSEPLGLKQGESHVGLIGNPYYLYDHAGGERDLTETDVDDKFLVLDGLANFKYDCCCITAAQRQAQAVFPDYHKTEVCTDYLRRRLRRWVNHGPKPPAIHSNILHALESNSRIHSPRTAAPLEKMELLRHAILYGPRQTEALLAHDTPLVWCNPISPLQYHPEQVREIIQAVQEYNGACYIMFSPEVMLGATGPVSLAGALAQHNAEVVAGVLLVQLCRPGTPVIYGSVSGVMDLRTMDISLGSFESILFNAAVVQLADSYGLPSRVQTGNTSARQPGVRAAVETAWGLQMGIAAGANLINTGLLDSTLMLSLEHLVLVDEMVSQLRGATAAATVDAEHLAFDVVQEEGHPGGNFMAHEHTVAHMKEAMRYSDFTGRTQQSYDDWYATAHRKVREILDEEPSAEDARAIGERLAAVAARLQEDDRTWREGRDGWWQRYVRDLG